MYRRDFVNHDNEGLFPIILRKYNLHGHGRQLEETFPIFEVESDTSFWVEFEKVPHAWSGALNCPRLDRTT